MSFIKIIQPHDQERVKSFSATLGVSTIIAKILLSRGISSIEQVQTFFQTKLAEIRSPYADGFAMADFSIAVERITRAVIGREVIGVFGDYDVDGLTSCAIIADYLSSAGNKVVTRIAKRSVGYGFHEQDAEWFKNQGCTLVITCDCGTSDHVALLKCQELQMSTIVVDHHQVPVIRPPVLALLNPHQAHCTFPFKGLASVGMAFYLVGALQTKLRSLGSAPDVDVRDFLDLVALGTIADLAPLTFENRTLVRLGLDALRRTQRLGLRALAEISGLKNGIRGEQDLSFKIIPRLNASGRLGDAEESLKLILAKDAHTAVVQAEICDEFNEKRKEIQQSVYEEACLQVKNLNKNHSVLVVYGPWNKGVVGIVAAKLVEKYNAPALVLGIEGHIAHGSGRTLPGFNLYKALLKANAVLLRYGGHASAVGLSIDVQNIPQLQKILDEDFIAQLGFGVASGAIEVDAMIENEVIDDMVMSQLSRLRPFGMGNPEPVLFFEAAEVISHKKVGEGHLQMVLKNGGQIYSSIAFGFAPRRHEFLVGSLVRVAFVPEVDTYKGGIKLRLKAVESI